MRNCLTYALGIEDKEVEVNFYSFSDLAYTRNTVSELERIAKGFNRSMRRLKSADDELKNGEWIMVLYGPIITKRDYEGRPVEFDVHAIKVVDGLWSHRQCIDAEVTSVPDSTPEAFASEGYEPQYFAVKRIED